MNEITTVTISSIIGLSIWVITVLSILYYLFLTKEDNLKDKLFASFFLVLIFGLLGMGFSVTGIVTPIKDIEYSHQTPTSIVKTNNMTLINHIVKNELVIQRAYSGAVYYNSTNILIRVTNGKNFYGNKVDPEYGVEVFFEE